MPKNKIVVFGDLHFGMRGDSIVFHEYQKEIILKRILPYLNENKEDISRLVFLGDIFDRRKSVNISTLRLVKWFFSQLVDFEIDIIVGNHDVFYRNTNEVNSPSLILEDYKNITVYDDLPVQDGPFLFVPWISPESSEEALKIISESNAKILFGHLEINNAILVGTQKCDFGLNSDLFSKFKYVFSGHFHKRQMFANIIYTGCLWELTRDDAYQTKGFFVLTMENNDVSDIEFVKITDKHKIFKTIQYDENILQKTPPTKVPILDLILPLESKESIEHKYVKVVYESNKNQYLWSQFLERLNSFNPAEITFQEKETESADVDENSDFVINAGNNDILEVVKTYLPEISSDQEMQNDIFQVFTELYKEAFQMEN